MDVTFYNDDKNRIVSYDNVKEINVHRSYVDVRCVQDNGDVFRTRVLSREYNRIEISKE